MGGSGFRIGQFAGWPLGEIAGLPIVTIQAMWGEGIARPPAYRAVLPDLSPDQSPEKPRLPVLAMTPPGRDTAYKAKELIEVNGLGQLTLQDQRIFDVLLRNAHCMDLAVPRAQFSIPVAALRTQHKANDRIEASLGRLQKTNLKLRAADSSDWIAAPLLGTAGVCDKRVFYELPTLISEVLSKSMIYAELNTQCLRVMRSKYSYALYQSVALRANLSRKRHEKVTVENLREHWLGIPR